MSSAEPSTFGELLKRYRTAARLTQEELAERAGLSARGVQDLERGLRRSPHPDTTRRLVEVLGLGGAERSELVGALDRAASSRARAKVARALDTPPSPTAPAPLPTGTVSFLFTDIEGSTRSWLRNPLAMSDALTRHDALIERLVARHGGEVVRPRGEGDSRFAVFATASKAVAAAGAIQVALREERWSLEEPLQVRIAVHTGEAQLRAGDYYGPAVNHCARLRAIAYAGQVLVSSVTADLVREGLTANITLRDLGEHRLKDLDQPEHVWQLVDPNLPTEFPPLHSVGIRLHNLPRQATSFVGRRQPIEATKTRLCKEGVRLLTLIGAGGIGKTRIALQVAAELADNYLDGVFFVPLAPIGDPSLICAAIAQVLGVRDTAGRSLLQQVHDYLQPKQLLLILDNFEHLYGAGPLIAELWDGCPRLSVLVTSRAVLRLAGEQIFEIQPMTAPDPQHVADLEACNQYEAIKLFIERARAVEPGFSLTAENAGAVAEICRRLDGLPLAIELAAARVRILKPEALLGRLSNRLGLLTTGARDGPVRHRTLRDAIAWSYELLTSAEQRLFERLAVFVGGFTLEAAETVASADGELGIAVLDGVASLVDQSLVGIKRPYGGLAQPRFELLETIREYASDRLMEAGKAMAVRASHAAYFLALAESLEPHLRGARQAESLANLDQERDNLRAALRCCVEHGAVEQGLRLAVALARFWQMRGYVTEGRKHLSDVLALARDRVGSEPSPLRATALAAAGNLASGQGDYAAAQAQLEASLLIWRALEDRHGIAASLNDLGALASRQGDYGTAHALLAGSLAIKEELGDRWDLAVSLANIGGVAEHQGDYAAARSWLEASLAIFRDVEDTRGIAISLNGLGVLAQDQGQYDAARRLHMESLTISREVRAPRGVASALKNLAWLAMHEGDYAAAYSLYDESLALSRELGDRFEMASTQITLGLVVAKQGDHTAAQRFFEDGMAGARDSGDQILVACALEGFAVLAASQKQVGRALRLAAGAARLRDTIRAPLARREQEFLEREFQQIRQALTVEQAAALWADGQAISEEQLVNYGLGVPAPPAKPMSTGCSQQARPDAMHCAS